MVLLTLDEIAKKMGWPVLSTKFNTFLPGFPEAVKNENNEDVYDSDAVYLWDRNRPIVHRKVTN